MYPQSALVEELLSGNHYRAVVATRDERGVPRLSPEFIWHWDGNAIWFSKFPRSRTAENAARFPEASVSIIDWAKFRGIQLKGLVTREDKAPENPAAPSVLQRLRGAGATEVYRLEVMEVYDVIPREGADLSLPLWFRKRYWMQSARPASFQAPKLQPLAIPETLRARIAPAVDMLRAKFVPTFVGSVGDDGVPNISPRFVLEVGSDFWFYGDGFRNKTFVNASRPSPLCIVVVDWERERGYLAQGWAEMRYTGDWLEKIRTHWDQLRFKVTAIQAVLFHAENIEEIGIARPSVLFTGRPASLWAGGEPVKAG